MNPQDEQQLESLVNRAVRGLPTRSAPVTLEMRVQAEIARRAALPWWRKSYVDWPMAARTAFAVLALGVVKAVLVGWVWAQGGVDTAKVKSFFAPAVRWIDAASTLVHAVSNLIGATFESIPLVWLYGGAAMLIALYVALFGLGAATYRTLRASS